MIHHEPSVDLHPVDEIEPEIQASDAYRIAAKRFLKVIEHFAGSFRDDKSSRWWQWQFALGTSHCMGKSMTHAASLCGVDRAAISKGAVAICNTLGLPPSPYMKDEGAREEYSKARKEQLA